jgi:Apea-like HEPN
MVDGSGLAASEAVPYSFRNRFRLQEGDLLDADVPEIKLADSIDDGLVILRAPEREMGVGVRGAPISQAGELVVQGSGYPDLDSAVAAGRNWRQYLTVALAREGKGVFFGPDDRVIPTEIQYDDHEPPMLLQTMGVKMGDRIIMDSYQLMVFPTQPAAKFINSLEGTPAANISDWLERFEKKISDAREREKNPWNRQKAIAYRLVHLALADSNSETRHIQLVTAIEMLLKKQNRPKPILDALKILLTEAKKWPDSQNDVKTRIAQILNGNKEESIRRAGSEQVAAILGGTYADKSAETFFEHVYDMRSGLVHRERPKKPRPKIDDIRKVQSELLRFTLDLLDAYDSD